MRAFELVVAKTGHPTDTELIMELRDCIEKFRPEMDGRKSEFWANTERLWPLIFRRPLDVFREIVQPVVQELEEVGQTPEYLDEVKTRFRV